jgi:hypothetical protein
MNHPRYVYTGSSTAEVLAEHFEGLDLRRGHLCDPVRRADGRVVRSCRAGIANALVRFEDGHVTTVSPRRLRLVEKLPRVYLVACSKSKRQSPKKTLASKLYAGDLYRKSRSYALKRLCREPEGRWYILSARYRLLHPRYRVFPYDATLSDMNAQERREWARQTSEELLSRLDERTHVVLLAGKRYRELLIPHLQSEGHPCSVPMRGLGIGEQKAWLKNRLSPQ